MQNAGLEMWNLPAQKQSTSEYQLRGGGNRRTQLWPFTLLGGPPGNIWLGTVEEEKEDAGLGWSLVQPSRSHLPWRSDGDQI